MARSSKTGCMDARFQTPGSLARAGFALCVETLRVLHNRGSITRADVDDIVNAAAEDCSNSDDDEAAREIRETISHYFPE
jgi:hypothetical protein